MDIASLLNPLLEVDMQQSRDSLASAPYSESWLQSSQLPPRRPRATGHDLRESTGHRQLQKERQRRRWMVCSSTMHQGHQMDLDLPHAVNPHTGDALTDPPAILHEQPASNAVGQTAQRRSSLSAGYGHHHRLHLDCSAPVTGSNDLPALPQSFTSRPDDDSPYRYRAASTASALTRCHCTGPRDPMSHRHRAASSFSSTPASELSFPVDPRDPQRSRRHRTASAIMRRRDDIHLDSSVSASSSPLPPASSHAVNRLTDRSAAADKYASYPRRFSSPVPPRTSYQTMRYHSLPLPNCGSPAPKPSSSTHPQLLPPIPFLLSPAADQDDLRSQCSTVSETSMDLDQTTTPRTPTSSTFTTPMSAGSTISEYGCTALPLQGPDRRSSMFIPDTLTAFASVAISTESSLTSPSGGQTNRPSPDTVSHLGDDEDGLRRQVVPLNRPNSETSDDTRLSRDAHNDDEDRSPARGPSHAQTRRSSSTINTARRGIQKTGRDHRSPDRVSVPMPLPFGIDPITGEFEEPRCSYMDDCGTGSPLRKVVSHIFGRNKLCTRQIPHQVWVHYCRKHYQRSRYRNPKGFALLQCDLVRKQVDRLNTWGGVLDWTIKVRKREEVRLSKESADRAAAATQRSPDGDVDVDMAEATEETVGEEHDEEAMEQGSDGPSSYWLQELVGPHKTTADVLDLLHEIEAQVAETSGNFPDVEILPNLSANVKSLGPGRRSNTKPPSASSSRSPPSTATTSTSVISTPTTDHGRRRARGRSSVSVSESGAGTFGSSAPRAAAPPPASPPRAPIGVDSNVDTNGDVDVDLGDIRRRRQISSSPSALDTPRAIFDHEHRRGRGPGGGAGVGEETRAAGDDRRARAAEGAGRAGESRRLLGGPTRSPPT